MHQIRNQVAVAIAGLALFVALLSGKVLAERVSPSVALLLVTAFAGIVLIVSPDLRSVEPDALLALGSGFFAALAYMFVRELRKTDSPASVVFWFAAASVAGSVVQAAPDLFSPDTKPLAALVGIGIGAGGGQVGITMAYQKANAAWVSAFSYLTRSVKRANKNPPPPSVDFGEEQGGVS